MDIYYKGFQAKICFSADADVFYGEVVNSKYIIAFQGKNPKDAELAMKNAVDQYLMYIQVHDVHEATIV